MIKKLIGLLSTLAVLAVMMLTLLFVGARVVGLTPYSVLSGSMEPAYSVGDLLYVRKIAPEEIEVGMPITFVANEHLVIVTHRVTDITRRTTALEPVLGEDGKPVIGRDGQALMQELPLEAPTYYFRTRGDANPEEDVAAVYEKNVIGTPVAAVPYLGHFVTMVKTPAGKVMAVCFGLVVAILMFLPEMMQAIEKAEKKKAQDETGAPEAADGENEEEDDNLAPDEDEIVCDEAAARGEDRILEEKGAAQGDDVVLKEKAAPEGEDVIVEDN